MKLINYCEQKLKEKYDYIDGVSSFNQIKVLSAFKDLKVSERHFNGTTGYGYGDEGRDVLGQLYAKVFGAESGIVSPHLLSGTHAINVALFGLLRPYDTLLCISGMPYDTIRPSILGTNIGSLKDFGVSFKFCELSLNNDFDEIEIARSLNESVKVVYIQRSRGYELRDALSCEQIANITKFLRKIGYDGVIFVDNCYGEFVEMQEPTDVGADICVGSLIKNAGGGLAPTGGYIVGKADLIEKIGRRFTTPAIGLEVGSFALGYHYFYQGLFMAPHTVAQALKTSLLIGMAMTVLGYKNYPSIDKIPHDITRAIQFDSAEKMIDFVREVQYVSPIDSYVDCEPWDMPGYDDKIIMAAGTFVSGASIELSADGPVKPPYVAYFQGGLTYEHGKYALSRILDKFKINLEFGEDDINRKVFISYSSKELDIVSDYISLLENSGASCWIAPKSIPGGKDYTACIPEAIDSCGTFLLFLSSKSQNSIWVNKELIYAISKGKRIIPVNLDGVEINNSFQFLLNNVQIIQSTNDEQIVVDKIMTIITKR